MFKESFNDLLDSMHTKPVAPVDKRVPSDELPTKGSIEVRLIREIELRNTSL